LYFMLINCPIAIVFNLKALKYWASTTAPTEVRRRSAFDDRSRVTDPNYRYMSCNVYNPYR
jgi:hypothetical protein